MLAQIQDNTHKAYVALQSYVTSPSNIPIPGVVRTDRPKLTREQMAARIREQNTDPSLDINRANEQKGQTTPVMTQKTAKTVNGFEKFDYELPMLPKERPAGRLQRSLVCESWDIRSVQDYLDERLPLTVNSTTPIKFNLVSERQPDQVCFTEVPEFVVCRYPSSYLDGLWEHTRSVLNYHDYEELPDPKSSTAIAKYCAYYDEVCPPPAVTSGAINQQIDDCLSTDKAFRIYLTRNQLDQYLQWRKDHRRTDELEYIVVSGGANVSATEEPSKGHTNAEDTGKQYGIMASIGLSIVGIVGFGGVICSGLGAREKLASTTSSEEIAAKNDVEDMTTQEKISKSRSDVESSSTIISISTSASFPSSDQKISEEDSSVIV